MDYKATCYQRDVNLICRSISILTAGIWLAVAPVARSAELIEQMRDRFPDAVAQFEARCAGKLVLQTFQNPNQTERVSFICWQAPDATGDRSGEWLGNLPLSADDATFVRPLTCAESDATCLDLLPVLRSRVPDQLAAAEFQCATRNGTLFLQVSPPSAIDSQTVDLRCGFFATSLIDSNSDDVVDYEDPVSVDISVARFDRAELIGSCL